MWLWLLLALALAYALYYHFVVCAYATVIFKDTADNRRIRAALTLLNDKFCPTFWMVNQHLQTVFNVTVRHKAAVAYTREIVALPDGGTLALDWVAGATVDAKRPTIILLTGFTGSSEELEIKILARDYADAGFAVVVMHFRGNGGAPLTTPRFSDSPDMDMVAVVDHVVRLLERAGNRQPLFAVGVSAGANAIALHCAHTGAKCKLDAFVGISNPFDIDQTLRVKLKQGIIPANVYDPFFVPKRLKVVRSHPHLFDKLLDMSKVESSRGAYEFDSVAVVPASQEFKTVADFYAARSSARVLGDVATPGLFINARDDPFTNIDTLKPAVVRANDFIMAVITDRGGHLGFVDGIRGGIGCKTWDERLADQYLGYMMRHIRVPRRLQ